MAVDSKTIPILDLNLEMKLSMQDCFEGIKLGQVLQKHNLCFFSFKITLRGGIYA